jgi:hypothetical protein
MFAVAKQGVLRQPGWWTLHKCIKLAHAAQSGLRVPHRLSAVERADTSMTKPNGIGQFFSMLGSTPDKASGV